MTFTKDQVLELLKPIQIVKVLEINKHPNADRLVLVKVTTPSSLRDTPPLVKGEIPTQSGEGDSKVVVTAATNMKPGDLVPYLGEGNVVPGFLFLKGEKITLEKRMMRGIESDSMILAEDEIGLSADHGGIYILDAQSSKDEELIGKSIVEVLSEEEIKMICKNAGVIEMTPELQARINLIKSVAKYGGEIVGEDELPGILTSGEQLFTYDGFEPSGQMHIAQGIIRAINTNKMIKAGFTFRMWIADWFGYLNNKMGGDMDKIQTVGKYFIEIWKASGMDLEHTEFLWTSDFVGQREYWELVMKIAKSSTLKRVLRTTEIMGRSETDDLSAAQIIYPCMQITDIFYVMKCQVTQLGLDQRKVNMLARELGSELGFWKPVVVSQGMLRGLQKPISSEIKIEKEITFTAPVEITEIEGYKLHLEFDGFKKEFILNIEDTYNARKWEPLVIDRDKQILIIFDLKMEIRKLDLLKKECTIFFVSRKPSQAEKLISMKMSKSKPDTAIFMTDSEEDVKRKIGKAYCPPGIVEDNPIMDYCKQLIFEAHHLKREQPLLENGAFVVERDKKGGGTISEYKSYEEVEADYIKGDEVLHPDDLKKAVIKYLNELLKPVREHFEKDENAKKILEEVRSFQVTR